LLKRSSLNYLVFSIFMDVCGVAAAFLLSTRLRIWLPYGADLSGVEQPLSFWLYPLVVSLWVVVASVVSLYDPKRVYKVIDEFQILTVSVGFFALGVAGLLFFSYRNTSRLLVIYAFILTWTLLLCWRSAIRLLRKVRQNHDNGHHVERVLIVGAGEVGQQIAALICDQHWRELDLAGYLDDDPAKHGNGLPVLGVLDDVERVVSEEHIGNVILALPSRAHERMNMVVSRLHTLPVNVRIVPDYFSLALYRATVDEFGGIPMINLRDPALNAYQRLVKRIFDLSVGSALTLVFLPLMGIIAIAIKLDSPGPVLFKQVRLGENGRLFEMYKFRSMMDRAESLQSQINQVDEEGNVIHKCKDDPRVTKVGRFLRRWSLDELPQFFNVLRGDLSLIGPRPELPWLVDEYEIWQRKRFAVPQGITGWWQVNGRSDKMMHLHTDEDLYYIQNYSLWLDIYILLKTPWVILRGKGAY
jgi:exopolysaccharide biosynthesis polyprenyl glycosylphosphotransferase